MPITLWKPFAACLGVLVVTQAHANTNWTDWAIPGTFQKAHSAGTAPAIGTPPAGGGYAISTTGTVADPNNGNASVTITLTGEIMQTGTSPNILFPSNAENPGTAYDDANLSSPVGSEIITQTGFTEQADKAHTITFSSSVSGVVMGIWSLGGGNDSSLLFSEDFEIVDSDGQLTRTVTPQGYQLTGNSLGGGLGGGAGLIRFLGSHTSITYTVTEPEFYSGMSVALTDQLSVGSGGPTITIDEAAPTLSSSNPTDDAQGVALDSNITLTFSENITDNGGTITLKKSSDNSTVEAFSGFSISGDTITLNPSSNLDIDTDYYIEISNGAVKDATGNLYAGLSGSTSLNFSTSRADPTTKADVVGTVEAATNSAVRFSQSSLRNIGWRFDWLRRNKDSVQKSVQGVNVAFSDPLMEQFFNGDPRALDAFMLVSAQDVLQKIDSNPDAVMSDVQNMPMELAMAEAQKQFGKVNLNPTGDPLVGDWSIWTAGQVTVGDYEGSSASDSSELKATTLAIGIDRPTNTNGILGYALNIGWDDTDIGNVGSSFKSKNYSISIYSGFEMANAFPVELTFGAGRMNMRMKRIDGSQTLTGNRRGDLIFGSAKIRQAGIERGNAIISPYVSADAAFIRLNDYSETGGNLALHYHDQNVRRLTTSLGVDVDWTLKMSEGTLHPFTNLEYTLDLSDNSDASMNYLGDSTVYNLALDTFAKSNWSVGVGLDYIHTESGMSSMIMYQRDEAVGVGQSDSLQIKLSMPF